MKFAAPILLTATAVTAKKQLIATQDTDLCECSAKCIVEYDPHVTAFNGFKYELAGEEGDVKSLYMLNNQSLDITIGRQNYIQNVKFEGNVVAAAKDCEHGKTFSVANHLPTNGVASNELGVSGICQLAPKDCKDDECFWILNLEVSNSIKFQPGQQAPFQEPLNFMEIEKYLGADGACVNVNGTGTVQNKSCTCPTPPTPLPTPTPAPGPETPAPTIDGGDPKPTARPTPKRTRKPTPKPSRKPRTPKPTPKPTRKPRTPKPTPSERTPKPSRKPTQPRGPVYECKAHCAAKGDPHIYTFGGSKMTLRRTSQATLYSFQNKDVTTKINKDNFITEVAFTGKPIMDISVCTAANQNHARHFNLHGGSKFVSHSLTVRGVCRQYPKHCGTKGNKACKWSLNVDVNKSFRYREAVENFVDFEQNQLKASGVCFAGKTHRAKGQRASCQQIQ
eukprot:CAMPEP_0203744504 /NCGR_PEP_ID=MMETSP0098-20131031/547_1 /ASSEMBLY_ACC=CAM_ASM_000208 /TAXON_ID=96639 /ORGANISM=" , Strain NY0313808BC1" /LENGTH=448 /DNA_ID=CAMNT_0050632037 /DNA_START=41 /DNA_END=1387 /DNA_ORIENTATION=+